MPTYEYECDSCGHDFETVQKMIDAPLKICPKCGKAIRRVLSGGIGISFKGSGFYVTDKGSQASPTKTASATPTTVPAASSAGTVPPVKPSSPEKTHK